MKKVQVGVALPVWLIAFMEAETEKQDVSRAVLIEGAFCQLYNITPPMEGK